MNDVPSDRIIDQRVRNRAMEALETLAEGNDGVLAAGVVTYVEQFFDWINDDVPFPWQQLTSLTPDEVAALQDVHDLLVEACMATPQRVNRRPSSIQAGPRVFNRQRHERSA